LNYQVEMLSFGMLNRIWLPSNEAIKQAVEAGLGIVSIHTLELEQETGRLQILDVHDFPILRHWYIM